MRLILACGSRDYTNREAIRTELAKYLPPPTQWFVPTVLHGDARGADRVAAAEALDLGFVVEAMPADWERHGRGAGYIRNAAMLDRRPDIVLAFWDGQSRGTSHTINEAVKRGIETVVVLGP